MLPKIVIIRAGILLAAAGAAALVFNWVSPAGIPLIGQWDTARGVVTARGQEALGGPGREIRSPAEARAVYEEGAAAFVDARAPDAFAEGHIPGALSLPVNRFEEWVADFWQRYPPESEFVIYCSGRLCEDSHRLAGLLLEMGYENVRVFIDGISGWAEAGYPVSRGAAGGKERAGS